MTAAQAFQELLNDKQYLETLDTEDRRRIFKYRYAFNKKKLKNLDTILELNGYVKTVKWEKKKIEK